MATSYPKLPTEKLLWSQLSLLPITDYVSTGMKFDLFCEAGTVFNLEVMGKS
jgi:hypothetical protein